jgi:hypothetical protein
MRTRWVNPKKPLARRQLEFPHSLGRLLLHSGAHVYLNKCPAGKVFPLALLSLNISNLSEAIPCRSFHMRAISKSAFRRICFQTANSRRPLPRSRAERRRFHCRACKVYAYRPILEAIACRSGTLMGAVTVNLDLTGDTRASLVDAIVSFGEGAYRKSEITQLLKQGAVTICFDNLQERRGKQFKVVCEFGQTYC